jgi:hypothetical protein
MVVEHRTEAVQKRDAAEPWAGGGSVDGTRDACGCAERPLDLGQEDPRQGRDGLGSVGARSGGPELLGWYGAAGIAPAGRRQDAAGRGQDLPLDAD